MKIKKSVLSQMIKEETESIKVASNNVKVSYQELVEVLGSNILLEEVVGCLKPEQLNEVLSSIVVKHELKVPLYLNELNKNAK